MEDMRVLGSMLERLAEDQHIQADELGKLLQCTSAQIAQMFKGRLFLSFDQLEALAKRFDVTVDNLLDGDREYYRSKIHCMGEFTDEKNREKIMDIIDGYLDLRMAEEQTHTDRA